MAKVSPALILFLFSALPEFEDGVGGRGGPMLVLPLPLFLVICPIFSLSDEVEAVGEGDTDAPSGVALRGRRRPFGSGVAP